MGDNTVKCVAVIPARGGSKGIPGKNLKCLGGVPLVARPILAAKHSPHIDAVYVSTDDREIAATALQYGAEIIDRPSDIAGDTASSEAALVHALETLAGRNIHPETLVFLQCTSPLTTSEAIDQVLAGLDSDCDMTFSAAENHAFIWGIDDTGAGYGLNHDSTRPRVRRQDLPPQYRETGAVYVMRVDSFMRTHNRFCGRVKPVLVNLPALEIDTLEDLHLVEAYLQTGTDRSCQRWSSPPAGIKVLVTDFDGVHTDDCVYVDESGKESVRCSRSDGMGIEMLRQTGLEVIILSKETNRVVAARAEKLGIPVIQGCTHKKSVLDTWLSERSMKASEIAYMGNDLNDQECMLAAGWSCCPADAHPAILSISDYVTNTRGGRGALREIASILVTSSPSCRKA